LNNYIKSDIINMITEKSVTQKKVEGVKDERKKHFETDARTRRDKNRC